MKNAKYLILTLLAGALLAGCCPCRKARVRNAEEIKRAEWQMTQFNGRNFAAGNGYLLTFNEEGRIGGVGDCNRLMGSYTLDNNGAMKIDLLASSRMMCPNQAQEDAFMKTLGQIDSWQMDGKLLMLFAKGELIAVFERK